jgi:Xaa-Pro aminopeptidase
VPKAVPGSAECPFISATSPGVVQPGMVLAFEFPWSVTGLGGFIVENRLPVSSDGIEAMNRLPDWLIELR